MRTKNTILNFITSFFPWIILAVLGFIKIKLFINNFGSEFNGLIQLVGQIYAYLGLLEMGFGAAVIYKLYKPFADNDYKEVSRIFKGSKRVYRIIGSLMFLGGIVSAIVAPLLLHSNTISKLYIFLIFVLFSFDYVIIYFLTLPYQSLLVADQNKYKINIITNIKHLIFRSLEVVMIIYKVEYIVILILSILFNLISVFFIINSVKKQYPWLDSTVDADNSTLKMTKDVFFHKISKVIFDNTDSILLSLSSGGLVSVSIYGAYNYILTYLRQILNFILSAPLESFGNLFNDQKATLEKKQNVFNEFLSISFYLGLIVTSIFLVSVNQFISIWISDKYQISFLGILIFSLILWYEYILRPIIIIIESVGRYKETKKIPIISSIINIMLSLLLVSRFGIIGVTFASLMVYIFIKHPMYVNYTYNKILNISLINYIKKFSASLLLLILIVLFDYIFISVFNMYNAKNLLRWIIDSSIIAILNLTLTTLAFWLISMSFRNFVRRMLNLRKNKNEN